MTQNEILLQSEISDKILFLPNIQLDRKLYQEVARALELIGGKWNSKKKGFVFSQDPTELIASLTADNSNMVKKFQYFPTPKPIAQKLVALAEISDSHSVLEPSAGQGAIIEAIQSIFSGNIDCYELMEINRKFLAKIEKVSIIGNDFLLHDTGKKYDRVVANPPFSKNQDIDHIMKMWEALNDGGRIVTMASRHWQISSNKKETAFREFLDSVNAEIIEVPAGSFSESGTEISTVILTLNK